MPNAQKADEARIDSREVVREALIKFRDATFDQWPEAIPYTVLLSHAIWWLAEEEE